MHMIIIVFFLSCEDIMRRQPSVNLQRVLSTQSAVIMALNFLFFNMAKICKVILSLMFSGKDLNLSAYHEAVVLFD